MTQAEFAARHHSDVSGGWLRAAVFGAMDGLVTSIALVAGVDGGGGTRPLVILTGMAGLVAGAFSMALGEFASVDTQNDAVSHEVDVERTEIRLHPADEQAELADMYEEMGLSRSTAEAVAREVHDDPELAVRVHVTQELGVDPDDQPSPWTAAVSSFLCFALGGIVP
ncbi:MAG: VIT1/CCC1 transporter family protein, partial [Pseudonocardia sp.]|nr:VIT1/CCC1 transporter family protein [Pseudonocardia sp.]